jgi:hypothetical protein
MRARSCALVVVVVLGVVPAHAARTVRLRVEMTVPARAERSVCQWRTLPPVSGALALVGWTLRSVGETHHVDVFDATDTTPVDTAPHDGPQSACVPAGLPQLVAAFSPHARLALSAGIVLPWHAPQAVVVVLHAVNGTARPHRARVTVAFRLRRRVASDRLAFVWSVSSGRFWSLPVGQTGILAGDATSPPWTSPGRS